MSVAVVTGSAGLIGSEAVRHFAGLGLDVVGIDNDMRATFFGPGASTRFNLARLQEDLGSSYEHHDLDIRDRDAVRRVLDRYRASVALVIHAAAQPSHDWAAGDPFVDFDINAGATLGLLEATRHAAPEAPFIFLSTNKVYGDRPNSLPLVELETRWEIEPGHGYDGGIAEDMPVDRCLHSLFGVSKLAADVLVQEYGRYFGMPTACFRGGTLTGPQHAATELHGFLGYVMRCCMSGKPYTVFGYLGKQVRDVIHSRDLIGAFAEFQAAPRVGEVYNIGGGRLSNASVIEAIALAEEISREKLPWTYSPTNRVGDHIWWISDNGRFESHYPAWSPQYDVRGILGEMHEANAERWAR